MVAVDTNVLIRIITGDDARQAATAEAFIARGAWISHVVLVETVIVLRFAYGLDHQRIATAVEMLLAHEHFELQEPEIIHAALAEYRDHPPLGFMDCLILETARRARRLPLGTFDRALGRAEGARRL